MSISRAKGLKHAVTSQLKLLSVRIIHYNMLLSIWPQSVKYKNAPIYRTIAASGFMNESHVYIKGNNSYGFMFVT